MGTDSSEKNIIGKALVLFSAHGYDGTGIQDITTAAGVTKPTLYYFFGSKDGLFEAVWQTSFPLLETQLKACCTYKNHIKDYENDVYGQLVSIALVFFRYALTYPDFYRLMMESVCAPPESKSSTLSTAYFKKLYSLLEQFFTGAAEVHGNMKGKALQFAASFLAQINAYAAMRLVLGEDNAQCPDLDEAGARQLVKQFMHGIFA
jgi:AcrR family transcriptional regulator